MTDCNVGVGIRDALCSVVSCMRLLGVFLFNGATFSHVEGRGGE